MNNLKLVLVTLGILSSTICFGQKNKKKQDKQTKKFVKLDKNSDGYLSFQEFHLAYQGRTNTQGEPLNIEKMFERKDLNRDGEISLEEFRTKSFRRKRTNPTNQPF